MDDLQCPHYFLQVRCVATVREKYRLAIISTDPGMVHVDMDNRLLVHPSISFPVLEADHKRSTRQYCRYVVAQPIIRTEKEVFISVETQDDMRMKSA